MKRQSSTPDTTLVYSSIWKHTGEYLVASLRPSQPILGSDSYMHTTFKE